MEEVIFRRYRRQLDENAQIPDLVVIDGGKGQLNSALKSIKELNLHETIPLIGIAKRLEEIYFPYDSVPLYLDKKSTTLKLIQHIRNEAHRFGLKLHQKKRSGKMLRNELEQIQGVGTKSIEKMMKVYGSIENIKLQPLSEIEKVVGHKIAHSIVEGLKNK
jgi:excinuclease ABC subunit C